jgi:hypothetical protein
MPAMAVQNADTANKVVPVKSPHLMCGNALWSVAGAGVSAYFSYLSYSHIINADYSLPHTWWTVLTYAVWIVLFVGLLTETHCGRERVFFGLVLVTFLLGFGFSAWSDATESSVRHFRIAATALWALAAVVSLTTLSGAKARA